MRQIALTTIDNPYDPVTEYDKWYQYDMQQGYDTCGLLDRITYVPDGVPDELRANHIEKCIDEFLESDIGLFVKYVKD